MVIAIVSLSPKDEADALVCEVFVRLIADDPTNLEYGGNNLVPLEQQITVTNQGR